VKDLILGRRPKVINTTAASYEVMVWFGGRGDTSRPIGLAQRTVASQIVNRATLNVVVCGQIMAGRSVDKLWVFHYFQEKIHWNRECAT
jgi:uncharacterized membrane protein YdcZ (DUF606 family)